jgi:hypothetical protein
VLTSVIEHTGTMVLATSIALVTVCHPVVLAKWLTTLGRMTDSRVIAGLGPGSSSVDYTAVEVSFEQCWARFDVVQAVIKAMICCVVWLTARMDRVTNDELAATPLADLDERVRGWGDP